MDFFNESVPLKQKKEKITKLVNSMIDDKNLFQKFKHKSKYTKEE